MSPLRLEHIQRHYLQRHLLHPCQHPRYLRELLPLPLLQTCLFLKNNFV
jgi:hypothetical protein